MSWFSKPHGRYRDHFDGIVKNLYQDCGHWPSGRSNKRDAMIEEITRLNDEQHIAMDVCYCKYQVWQGGQIQPCNDLVWSHEDLCPLHKPLVDESPWEYQFKNTIAVNWRNLFYGLPRNYDPTVVYNSGQHIIKRYFKGLTNKR